MKNKGLGAGLWIVLLVFVTACGNTGGPDSGFDAAFVTDADGLTDGSFNQTAWDGLKRAEKELDADIDYLESKKDGDYIPHLTQFARNDRDIIWGVGFKLEKAISEVANRFPEKKFGMVDSNLGGNIPDNVVAIAFKEEEGSFLMGVIAGKMTKTDKVGFLGGITSPVIKRFESGFRAGVHAVNPDAEVLVSYTEDFNDTAKGRSLAADMYNGGADIIYQAAGKAGKGLFHEVKTREQNKYWAIGVDRDQSAMAPDRTLTSMVKRVDVAVFDIMKELKRGAFAGGKEVKLGLKEGGVAIAETSDKHVPEEVLKEVENYKMKIVKGKINVPSTEDDLKTFKKNQ
ncbi:BMP family lipoprotein [Paludifilum halophilum]|uniref:BMP family ABC transporter substrate-binding protein n=1 Tax=Paludifilum halophilum TaxID=1642702 RepID=A0A235BB56_9BACL|nr:BMP family ABC transporter substrate-binding protein [Paludifilum halophilum]OYD09506.1 BMP family ABC transporter substrate-binding protein [Paludifilum halophilum]